MPEAAQKEKGLKARFAFSFRAKSSGARAGSIDGSLLVKRVRNVPIQIQLDISRPRVGSLPSEDIISVVHRSKQDAIKANHSHQLRQTHFPASREWERDKQTGERTDHTAVLHGLVDEDSELVYKQAQWLAARGESQSGSKIASRFSLDIWRRILQYASPADAATLAFSCKAFRDLLGLEAWNSLNDLTNYYHKINFLIHMDRHLPGHLLCFNCATYHIRIQNGQESLKPTNIRNLIFNCPNITNPDKRVPRIRLTFGRTLPFTFAQLAMRAHRYSPAHGIKIESLARRYSDRDGAWSHQTRYAIVNGHLLLRVVSTCFAPGGLPPAGQRHLLYSREDFVPYFSVCAHWRDGELMPMVKCAMSHIPKRLEGSGLQRVGQEVKQRVHRPNPIVVLCPECRPMRRCPDCPTEYLIELKTSEDPSDAVNIFKQALVVTRWSDLGDGSSPLSPEWAACNGEAEFESFAALGKRAISGQFEAHFNGDLIPGQRILSLNPKNERRGEAGHNWY